MHKFFKTICFLCKGHGKLEVSISKRSGILGDNKNRTTPLYRKVEECPVCNGKGYLAIEERKK